MGVPSCQDPVYSNFCRYDRFRRELHIRWKFIDDYIFCSKFKFDERQDEDDIRYAFCSLSQFQETNRQVIAVSNNDFPYYVANNVEHWVLWKMRGVCANHDILCTQQSHSMSTPERDDCRIGLVYQSRKSIRDTVQIFCLVKPAKPQQHGETLMTHRTVRVARNLLSVHSFISAKSRSDLLNLLVN